MAESRTSITLVTADGPMAVTHEIGVERPCTVGRLKESDLCLLHENVSRQHASIVYRSGSWFVVDLESKWGTFLNGVRLTKHRPTALAGGDLLRIGPWTFRVLGLPGTSTGAPSTIIKHTTTLDDIASSGQRVERAPTYGSAWKADRRLKLVLESMSRLVDEAEESALARTALELLLSGSGYSRGAALRRVSDGSEVEVVAEAPGRSDDHAAMAFSRSLLAEALTGQPAFLTANAPYVPSQSMAELRIHSAVCMPVTIGGTVVGFLYLDARGRESEVHSDALAFCEAVSCAYSLALANIKRAELESRERMLSAELAGARAVQELLMPALKKDLGVISYAARTQPGLFVAGDLFDVIPLPGGGFGVLVGDVSGRGAAAGMHMAMVQAYMHAELRRGASVRDAVAAVNRYLFERIVVGRFVSLWVGTFDETGTVRFVDAGHGHWFLQSPKYGVRHGLEYDTEGGIPLGIEPTYDFREAVMTLEAMEKLVLFSDGLIEQRDPGGQQFKRQRLASSIPGSASPEESVEACFRCVGEFACRSQLDDDATIVVVQNTSVAR